MCKYHSDEKASKFRVYFKGVSKRFSSYSEASRYLTGLPHLFFFRHHKDYSGARAGQPLGKKSFYKWWKRACHNLKIQDVDLYGGTRHSSVSSLRHNWTKSEIKLATMHSSNAAFERYYQHDPEELRKIYEDTRTGKELAKQKRRGYIA